MKEVWQYPQVKEIECDEELHGFKVSDPYRWLEDPDSKETQEFVEEQNKLSLPYLEKCDVRQQFYDKLENMFNYPKQSCPGKHGDKFYYSYNTGLQNQYVIYQQSDLQQQGSIFLDPNEFSEDGTVALGGRAFSEDGSILAYSISVSGSDWRTVKFMKTDTKEELGDVLEDVKFSCLSWTHDNQGIFYNRYNKCNTDNPGTENDTNVNQKLYYHKLGTPQSSDALCLEFLDQPTWLSEAEVSDCGCYVIVTVKMGCQPVHQIWIHEINYNSGALWINLSFNKVVDNFDASYRYVTNVGRTFYFQTNKDAPKYKIASLDLDTSVWCDVMPESDNLLDWCTCVRKDLLVMCYLIDCTSKLYVSKLDGRELQEVPLTPGSITGYSGRYNDDFIFFKFTSFTTPGIIYHIDLKKEVIKAKVYSETTVGGINSNDFETKQIFFKSKDGVDIPLFVTHKKGLKLDGTNPTLMYGYGGFNISLPPSFSVSRMIFVKHLNGVYCQANIRGGGEYGKDWYEAGIHDKKQNCFNDFIAAAEALCKLGYTSPNRLAIQGHSNGGLLVAACSNQRPDLFRVCLCHVGVLDMFRFHKFTIGHAWKSDFGDPEKEANFKWLQGYSPLHTIPQTGTYPSMLLFTADHDDRVVPLHTLKFVATLQKKLGKETDRPLIVKVDTKSGHGAGKPTSKVLQESSECYGFIANEMGLSWAE